MPHSPSDIKRAVAARLPSAQKFLQDIVALPSPPGQEAAVIDHAAGAFGKIAEVERVALSDSIKQDEDYSDPVQGLTYHGRSNLRVVRPGNGASGGGGGGKGKRLLFNSHVDTVPPSEGHERPYDPQLRDGAIWGRGSCDAKGQVATIYLALAALQELGVKLPGDVIGHVVVEEEVGGNGTLAMVRRGEQADACVVLEPTELRLMSSVRGAIWFHVDLHGQAGHSGAPGQQRSALKMAIRVVEILEGYHGRLLAASRGDPLFDRYPNPMPLTIGNFHAGNWPASAPGHAFLEGVLGLLPNKTAKQVMDEFVAAIRDEAGPEIASSFAARFMYRHDASVVPTDHPIVKSLLDAGQRQGHEVKIDAMPASCDACFYQQIGIPTIVFGGGSLSVAHSVREHMPVAGLAAAAEALTALACEWCG